MPTTDELDTRLNELIPPGTVVAYAGRVADNGGLVEVKPGWLLCNGAAVSDQRFDALYDAIQTWHGDGQDGTVALQGNTFNLPDYRGMFLRGVAGARTDRDPNTSDADRPANHPGGNTGNRVGSTQDSATKFPSTPFKTKVDGAHSHTYKRWTSPENSADENYFRLVGEEVDAQTTGDGLHSHEIEGGDKETRPRNAYVNWIIKT